MLAPHAHSRAVATIIVVFVCRFHAVFRTPGDPASHPGCAMNEAGDLQCAEDFAG